jgi:acid phosphatase (class A)
MKKFFYSCRRFRIPFVVLCFAIIVGCGSHLGRGESTALPELQAGSPEGYLPSKTLPNSRVLLPPPPKEGSAAFVLDEAYSRKSLALHDTPAWTMAMLDADLTFPNVAATYSCALNAPVTERDTPHLYKLLGRALTDALHSTKAAKEHYQRPRPFLLNKAPICTPKERERLEKSGSYPSGHNAASTVWALILVEISPEQTNAILARGQAFGVSRMICNVHWYSDTLQGRYMGSYTAASLHADNQFLEDLKTAKAELEAARARGLKATRDCKAEAAAMDLQQSLFR